MPETRAYKLNEQRQPGSRPGTLIYHYYDPDGRLTSQEVSEELFDALSDMDEKFYALERREEYHNVRHLKPSPHNHVFCPRKIEDLPDKKMADVLQQQEDSADLLDARALFRGDDKRIYRMHFLEKLPQEEIAAALNKSQSYVSKRLAKIKETLESKALQHDRSKKEAYAERQWEQFLEKFRTENDEDILFDLFRCVCGSDLQEAFLEWFYSYREYSKFCLQYLILRPFDNASDEEFKQRLNRLSEWQRLTYRLQFAEQLEEVRWLYIALCEKMNERQEKLQTPPSHPDEEKVQKEAERIARRLGMTAEEYVNGRFLPKIYKRLGKRYADFRRKYRKVVVIEEDDPRPVREQIVSIFGEGPEPRFRNPEFEDKDGKKGS